MTPLIKLITHPHSIDTLQARIDFAEVSGLGMIENPWWYQHVETGRQFYDLVACIGWPENVMVGETRPPQPGYAAIVGVVRPADCEKTRFDPRKANMHLMAEAQHMDVPTLLKECDRLRRLYGFGINKELLNVFYGDPGRFTTALALQNETFTQKGGERAALIVTPPNDYNLKNRFEIYLRALKGVVQKGSLRFYLGKGSFLLNRLEKFRRDDPAVTAIGGLVHTMLGRTMWMGDIDGGDNAFYIDEKENAV